ISQEYYVGMPSYDAEWYPPFGIRPVMTPLTDPAQAGRTFTQQLINPHNATHVDVPAHFFADAETVENMPLGRFVGPAIVADLTTKNESEPVTEADLEAGVGEDWERGVRLLIRTDYHHRCWGRPDFWQKAPYLTDSAARWMVDHEVSLVGIDCLTEKPGGRDFPVHRMLLESKIPILEYLTNLHNVRDKRVFLVALPIKVCGVEAAPVRAVVLEGLMGDLDV
ncbi:cyclase family protein, partial [Myxococcota bacterium]